MKTLWNIFLSFLAIVCLILGIMFSCILLEQLADKLILKVIG